MSDNKKLKNFDSEVSNSRIFGFSFSPLVYVRDVIAEFMLISWIPEEGMKYFLKVVLLSILFSGFVVYSLDVLTGLFIREISVIIGSFF